jgi:putative hemolysin
VPERAVKDILISCAVVLVLILIGALFVATEIALVSLRESQIKALGERGRRGRRVLQLSQSPNRFLAAAQIGVTFAGFLSAAFGESRISSKHLEPWLKEHGVSESYAGVLSLVLITLVIAYVAIVLGELVPKRFGLQRAEGVALTLAPFVDRVARITRPAIWLFSKSTDAVVRVMGLDPNKGREAISEEELRDLVAAHESLTKDERKLIDDVFSSGERQLREVMVPRTEVEFLDAAMTVTKAAKIVAESTHSRFPVVRGSHDDVAGFVHVRDLIHTAPAARRTTRLTDIVREVALFPETRKVLSALSEMRRQGQHIAVVMDEYGGTAGIVTLEDLIEEVIGDIRDEYDVEPDDAVRLGGGDIEVEALLNLDEFCEQTGLPLPDGPYETVGGYVMAVLGRLPKVGVAVELEGAKLKVTAMDGRRVERVLVTVLETAED